MRERSLLTFLILVVVYWSYFFNNSFITMNEESLISIILVLFWIFVLWLSSKHVVFFFYYAKMVLYCCFLFLFELGLQGFDEFLFFKTELTINIKKYSKIKRFVLKNKFVLLWDFLGIFYHSLKTGFSFFFLHIFSFNNKISSFKNPPLF